MDIQTLAYFIRTNRDGRAEECREQWKKMWGLDYPYLKGADNKIYEHEPGERHETNSAESGTLRMPFR
jgi:hypothetical protein